VGTRNRFGDEHPEPGAIAAARVVPAGTERLENARRSSSLGIVPRVFTSTATRVSSPSAECQIMSGECCARGSDNAMQLADA
jgi:hypothetical protein